MSDKVKVEKGKLSQFRPATENANGHTPRGLGALGSAMGGSGYVAPMTAATDGEMIDGSARLEVAFDRFGDEAVIIRHDGKTPIVMIREDIPNAKTPEAKRIAYESNRVAELDLSWDPLQIVADLDAGVDLGGLWNDDEMAALLDAAGSELLKGNGETRNITKGGRLYNAGAGHGIEPFKLAYRIEAAWRADPGLALDLYSGEGQLAAWYKRRFNRVVTVDKAYQTGDVDYSMTASEFIKSELVINYFDFDFIDFDDEGAPAREIQLLFNAIAGKKKTPFVLALTDGNGLNLKCRGKLNFGEVYLTGESGVRHATLEDYRNFGDTVTSFVRKCAEGAKFTPTMLSSYLGREGNVLCQTWLIEP